MLLYFYVSFNVCLITISTLQPVARDVQMTTLVISMTMRARDNMITQGIKRWLQSLFAWWPWRRSSEDDYAQTHGTVNKGAMQETLFFTTVDGPYAQPAQPGITSVAVEPIEDDAFTESNRATPEERSFPLSKPIVEDSGSIPAPIVEEKIKTVQESSPVVQEVPVPTPQQRLEFLRYLVERGIVNEGHRD